MKQKNTQPPQDAWFAGSVIVPDRIGVLRDITRAIAAVHGNLVDLRQVVVGGCFGLTFVVSMPPGTLATTLQDAIASEMAPGEAGILVRPFTPSARPVVARGARFAFAISGPDAPGRVFEAAQFFVARGINIEDWQHAVPHPGMAFNVGRVTIPDDQNFMQLQEEFAQHMAPLGLTARLLHENLFRATNEIGPIHALLHEPLAQDLAMA